MPIERVEKNEHRYFGPVRLSRADIEDMIALLSDWEDVHLLIGEYKLVLGDLDELASRQVRDISVRAYRPGLVQMEATRTKSSVYCSDMNDSKMRGVAEQLGDILRRRQRSVSAFLTHPRIWGILTGAYIGYLLVEQAPLVGIVRWFGIALLAGWLGYGYVWFLRHSVIDLSGEPTRGFLQRNKDYVAHLIIGISSAAFGSFVTWLLLRT